MEVGEVQLSFTDLTKDDNKLYIREITYSEAKPFIMDIHYARRMPMAMYKFGLFKGMGNLIGIITYGLPASPSLCKGLAGEKNFDKVLELNRLVIKPEFNGKNYASYFISHTLKMLPNYTFVVSYADTGWSHVGYVYQATNWLYTGITQPMKDKFSNGKHPRGNKKNVEGEKVEHQNRTQKHRYVYLVGTKREKKQMLKELKYPIQPYPKGDEIKYDTKNPKPIIPIKKIEE